MPCISIQFQDVIFTAASGTVMLAYAPLRIVSLTFYSAWQTEILVIDDIQDRTRSKISG